MTRYIAIPASCLLHSSGIKVRCANRNRFDLYQVARNARASFADEFSVEADNVGIPDAGLLVLRQQHRCGTNANRTCKCEAAARGALLAASQVAEGRGNFTLRPRWGLSVWRVQTHTIRFATIARLARRPTSFDPVACARFL